MPDAAEPPSGHEEGKRVVERCLAAINAHDRDAFFAVLDPQVEWHMVGYFLDQEPERKGPDHAWAYIEFLAAEFQNIDVQAEEMIEAGDRLVVSLRVTANSIRTGAPGELRYASVFTIRDELIVEVRNYTSKEEALADVGG